MNTDRALQLGLREVEASSAALSESLRQHLEAVRLMSASLPKLLSGFERGEGQRIDSIKMALKKLINSCQHNPAGFKGNRLHIEG